MSSTNETDYEIGQDNVQLFGLDVHNPVFVISGLTIIGFVLITLMFQEGAGAFFGWLRPAVTSTFDWFFLASGNLFVLFALLLVITPLGKVRLGDRMRFLITAILAGLRCYSPRVWASA